MVDSIIQTHNLTKIYQTGAKALTALDNLNLEVQKGEVFGYLGPNGAGKSTTIRILLDMIRPQTGHVTLFGMDSRKDRVAIHQRLGYLPSELNLWDYMTGQQTVQYVASIRKRDVGALAKSLAARFDLDLSRRVKDYSTGNKRKLGIVLAFMHQPELVILDEPTTGLDPLVQQTFIEFIKETATEGRTVFMSSHILSEVQALCGRVGILRQGQLKAIERVDKLTQVDFRWVTLTLNRALGVETVSHLAAVQLATQATVNGSPTLRFRLSGPMTGVLQAVGAEHIVDIATERPSLEDIFLTFYDQNNHRKEA